jgi:hypothetical protein
MLKHHNTGPIWPQIGWPYLAANRVALSGRKRGGSIWPQLKWLYVPANSHPERGLYKNTNMAPPAERSALGEGRHGRS